MLKKIGLGVAGIGGAVASFLVVASASATTLFTVPSATTTFTGFSTWSSEAFDSFLPIIYVAIGILAGTMFVHYIRRQVSKGVRGVLGAGRGGRRGRRR